jgi:hypothetical protein
MTISISWPLQPRRLSEAALPRAFIRLSLCLALTAAHATTHAVSPTLHSDATELPNAIYHLACLGGQIPCTKDVFERFWHERLQWTPADQRELDEWTVGLGKVESAAGPLEAAPFVGNYRSFFPDLDAQLHIIHAALESGSFSAFQHRTERWLSLDEAARLHHAIAYFRGRLRPWWRTTAHNTVKARVRPTEKTLRSAPVVALAGEVAAFVEAESPASDFYVHLIPGPEPKSDAATGTFLANHCFVEVTDAATPDGIASVGIHELTHYLYETAQAHRHLELMQHFVRAEIPQASAFYALLNEALATAVQRLLSERARGSHGANGANDADAAKSDDGEYRHLFIPRFGRSTAPVLKEALAKGSTLYQGFAQAYVREATRELGEDISNPKFILTSAAILPTDKAESGYQPFLKEFEPVNFIRSNHWRLFPYLNLVFLLAYDELGAFATAFPDLASHTNGRGFAYMASRDGQASIFILAGADAAAIDDVVRAFAKLQSVSSSGLVLSID